MLDLSVENEIAITHKYKEILERQTPPEWRQTLDPNREGYNKKEATKISMAILRASVHRASVEMTDEAMIEFNEVLLRKMPRLLEETMTATNG